MSKNLDQKLRSLVTSNAPLLDIVAGLRELKKLGLTQGEAYHFLERLRDAADAEPLEDRILEVMDFVSGFCTSEQRIWGDKLSV